MGEDSGPGGGWVIGFVVVDNFQTFMLETVMVFIEEMFVLLSIWH